MPRAPKSKEAPKAKSAASEKGTIKFVCIRRCFDRGRFWKPQREAAREKDYLLEVPEEEAKNICEKNFMRVDKAPEAVTVEPEAPMTLGQAQTVNKGLDTADILGR